MKLMKLLTFSALTVSSFANGVEEVPKVHDELIHHVDHHLESTRIIVQDLAKDNADVMQQYDSFVGHLRQSYIDGEGMIYSDLLHILKAVEFAAEKHQFQVRKDPNSTPYIIHPIGVAENVFVIGHVRDPSIIMGALLHDTVEDTDTSFEEIMEHFGPTIHGYVIEVTDDKSLSKAERKRLQIVHAPHKSAGAAQIKLGDKLYNLRDLAKCPPAGWEQERIDQYFAWAKNVVDRLPWVNAALKQAVDEVIAQHQGG